MFKSCFPIVFAIMVLIGCSNNKIKMGYSLFELNKTLNTELVKLSGEDNISAYLYENGNLFSVFVLDSQYGLYGYSTHIIIGQDIENKFKETISKYNKKYGNSLYDEENKLYYWTNTKNKLPKGIIELWGQMTKEDNTITFSYYGDKFIVINQDSRILHN